MSKTEPIKINKETFSELASQRLEWLASHGKYGWAPADLLELFAQAKTHFHQQLQQLDKDGVPGYKIRGIKEYWQLVEIYSPPFGTLSRIAKRTKAYKKGYKRSKKEGYQQQTEQEIGELKEKLNITLDWELDPELAKKIQKKLDTERQRWSQKKREIEESAKRWKAQENKDAEIGRKIRDQVKKSGGKTFGWDLEQVGRTFYQPIKNGKINYTDVPAILKTAAILRDQAGDVLPDRLTNLLKSAIIITGEGHQKMLPAIQKTLMIDSDIFKASRFDQVKEEFQRAGFLSAEVSA